MVALGLVATAACPAIAQPVFLEKQALLCTTVAAVQAPIDVEPPTVTAGQQRPMVLTAISGTGRRGRCFWGPTGISLMIVGGEGDLSLVRVTRQRDALFVRSSALRAGVGETLTPAAHPEMDALNGDLGISFSRLGITAAQRPMFDAYVAALRDKLEREEAFRAVVRREEYGAGALTMFRLRLQAAQLAAETEDHTMSAFSGLYAALTVQQKAIADALYGVQP